MQFSKEVRSFAYSLAAHYSKFDQLSACYTLHIDDISDFDIHELSAMLLVEDESYASEATGPDNNSYTNKMLPALINLLKYSTDRDYEIEFVSEWKKGIISYQKETLQKLISDALDEYNEDEGYTNKEDPGPPRWAGEVANIWAT
jgi:hypothetical protein